MLIIVNNLHEKCIAESQEWRNFGSTHAICNRTFVTLKMHLFSANQTCVIFSYILLQLKDNLVLSTESELIMWIGHHVEFLTEVVSVCPSSEQKVWLYNFIFLNSAVTCVLFFQDPKNKRFTLCDEQLQQVFGMYVNLGLWQIVNNCTWYMWLLFLLNSLSMVERCRMRWNSSSKRHGQNKNQNTVNFAPYSWQQMQVFFSTDRAYSFAFFLVTLRSCLHEVGWPKAGEVTCPAVAKK